jgi:hypothetical protein
MMDEPCMCNTGPDTDGPDECCPQHGRPYTYWVRGCEELNARLAAPPILNGLSTPDGKATVHFGPDMLAIVAITRNGAQMLCAEGFAVTTLAQVLTDVAIQALEAGQRRRRGLPDVGSDRPGGGRRHR